MTEQRPVRERLRGLAERHRADRPWAGTTRYGDPLCTFCRQSWPCDARALLDELDTLERRAISAERLNLARLERFIDFTSGKPQYVTANGIRQDIPRRLHKDILDLRAALATPAEGAGE